MLEPLEPRLPTLRLGAPGRSWWLLDGGQPVTVRAVGPGPLRIDTRLLDPVPERVLEVELDGERVDWFRFDTKPSKSAAHVDHVVGKRKRGALDLEPGPHEVRVRLVAPTDHGYLVRVRALEQLGED